MKKQNKLWGILLSICMLITMCDFSARAAGSGSVTLSNPSGTVGSTVTVSGTVSTSEKFAAATIFLSYDQAALKYVSGGNSGGSGSVKIFVDAVDNPLVKTTFSIKFQILKQGSSKINFESIQVVADSDMQDMAITKSGGTITGKAPTSKPSNGGGTTTVTPEPNKDGNNKLSSLQVYPGTLSPAFSADTTAYTVTVPSDTTAVTITAAAKSSKATVNVSGGKDLKLGPNEARVIVTAENGTSVAYNITIMCGEVEKIQIGGAEHTINENFTDEQIPSGFTRTKVTYNEREYEALTNNSLQLMSLQTGETTAFYIYNQETKEFYNFVQIVLAEGRYIIPLPPGADVAEFAEYDTVTLQVQDKSFDAWKLDEEFSVAYVMNQDGEKVLYRYDNVDGTFQRYKNIATESEEAEEKTLFPNQYYMYAIVGLGALVIILLIAMIYFIASRKARHEGRKRKAIKKIEKQKAREEKEAEKQRAIEEKQRAKEEKKLAKQKKKNKEE